MILPGFNPCDTCYGGGIDYCDSCYEEGPDGVGHGPCPDCVGTGLQPDADTVEAVARWSYNFDDADDVSWENQEEWRRGWYSDFVLAALLAYARQAKEKL